jgi:membrane protein
MGFRNLWDLVRRTLAEWSEDKAPRLAAALAYYTVFSIPPLLLTIIGIASRFFDRAEVQQAILSQISNLLNQDTANAIGGIIESAGSERQGGVAAIIGAVVLLLGASAVFGQLQDSLNTIWEVRPKPNQGVLRLVQKRLFSFLIVLVLGFLLLVSMVLSTALAALSELISTWLPGSNFLFQLINFVLPFVVITLLFALMFKFIPDAKIAWRDVWLGAVITSLLFNIGKTIIGLYLARSNPASAFGAAASIVLIFVWIYYTAQILFIGAEFTQVYASTYGSGVVPEKYAEKLTEKERNQQGIPRSGEDRVGSLNPSGAQGSNATPVVSSRSLYWKKPFLSPERQAGAERSLITLTSILTGLAGVMIGLVLGKKNG